MSNHDVPAPAPAPAPALAPLDGVAVVAAADRGGFPDLRNRRFRTAVCYAVWGVAGIMSTTTAPSLSVNPDHVMLYFLLLIAGVMLHLLSMAAAADLPQIEGLAASLEGILAKMIGLDF